MRSDVSKGCQVAWVIGWLLLLLSSGSSAYEGERVVDVEVSRSLGRSQSLEGLRRELERELRRSALQGLPRVIEWDRVLRDEVLNESTKESTVAIVRLQAVREVLATSADGTVTLTLKAQAVVDDTALARWANQIQEVEALRNELSDVRRRTESEAVRRGREPAIGAVSSVHLRHGDAADLAALAEASSTARTHDLRNALLDVLRSAVLDIGAVKASKSPGSNFTGFSVELAWKLPGALAFANDFERELAFRPRDDASGIRFFDARTRAEPGSWRLRQQLMWTRVFLELRMGAASKSIPVAYPSRGVSMAGSQACVDSYAREALERRWPPSDMGWCFVEAGGTSEGDAVRPDVRSQATVWVTQGQLPGAVGPEATWVVQWDGGAVDRVPAVSIRGASALPRMQPH